MNTRFKYVKKDLKNMISEIGDLTDKENCTRILAAGGRSGGVPAAEEGRRPPFSTE